MLRFQALQANDYPIPGYDVVPECVTVSGLLIEGDEPGDPATVQGLLVGHPAVGHRIVIGWVHRQAMLDVTEAIGDALVLTEGVTSVVLSPGDIWLGPVPDEPWPIERQDA